MTKIIYKKHKYKPYLFTKALNENMLTYEDIVNIGEIVDHHNSTMYFKKN